MNSQRVKRTIKKTKSISNQNTWYQIKHLIKTRKLEKYKQSKNFMKNSQIFQKYLNKKLPS